MFCSHGFPTWQETETECPNIWDHRPAGVRLTIRSTASVTLARCIVGGHVHNYCTPIRLLQGNQPPVRVHSDPHKEPRLLCRQAKSTGIDVLFRHANVLKEKYEGHHLKRGPLNLVLSTIHDMRNVLEKENGSRLPRDMLRLSGDQMPPPRPRDADARRVRRQSERRSADQRQEQSCLQALAPTT